MLLWVSAGLEKICTLDSAQMPGGDRKNISHVWRFCISGSGSDITRYSSSVGRKIDFESVHIIYWEEFDLKNKLKIIIKRKNLFRIFSISVHSSGYLSDRWLSCTRCLRDIVCVCVCVGGGGGGITHVWRFSVDLGHISPDIHSSVGPKIDLQSVHIIWIENSFVYFRIQFTLPVV